MQRLTAFALLAAASSAPALAQLPYLELQQTYRTTTTPTPGEFRGPVIGLGAGAGGAWVASAAVETNLGLRSALFGIEDPTTTPQPVLLRVASGAGSGFQGILLRPRVAGGRLAYMSTNAPGFPLLGERVWLGSELTGDVGVVAAGSPVLGQSPPSAAWIGFRDLRLTPAGVVWVLGDITGPGPVRHALAPYPTGATVVRTGDRPDGLPGDVTSIDAFDVSPDGSHWAALVHFGLEGRSALLLDGAVLSLGQGLVAVEDTPTPTHVWPSSVGLWGALGAPRVNDAGEVAFSGAYGTASAPGFGHGVFTSDGRTVTRTASPAEVLVMGSDGMAVWRPAAPAGGPGSLALMLETAPLTRPYQGVDADHDGVVDPGWLAAVQAPDALVAASGDGDLYGAVEVAGPGLVGDAVLRLALHREDPVVCAGQPNSLGREAVVRSVGSDIAAYNRLALLVTDLPNEGLAMMICSKDTGFTARPGGSQGDLCLGGAIGRFVPQAFGTGLSGEAGSVELFLNVLPQPTGPVAAVAGETWHFQAWYRDLVGGTSTSNFSRAISVELK